MTFSDDLRILATIVQAQLLKICEILSSITSICEELYSYNSTICMAFHMHPRPRQILLDARRLQGRAWLELVDVQDSNFMQ